MKNWDPFVFGPLLAIETIPLELCCKEYVNYVKYLSDKNNNQA